MTNKDCPDCGFWMAGGPCSSKYDGANEEVMEAKRLEIYSRSIVNSGYDLMVVELGR
jgi:hypothetical protein